MLRVVLVWLSVMVLPSAGFAQQFFGPFIIDPASPGIIFLSGKVDDRSALEFRRVLAALPNATAIVLNSPGGSVQSGLLIAEEVHERGMSTIIPEGHICASACSWIFFAGHQRHVVGRLGVHQISGPVESNAATQLNLSDVVEALNKYGTPPQVLAVMLRTPPDNMYFFTPDEIESLGLNRTALGPPSREAPSATYAPDTQLAVDTPARARKFVEYLVEDIPDAEILAVVVKHYAPEVAYYGTMLTRDEVLDQKRLLLQKIEKITATIQPGSVSVNCVAGVCEVHGDLQFSVLAHGKRMAGEGSFHFRLDMTG